MQFGRFTVQRLIGQGGMASVYEACDAALNRRVAIKVLHPAMASNKELLGRFLLEGHIVNGIRHPSMVAVHEQGQLPDGSVYQVMDLLEGETLAQRISRRTRLRLPELLHLASQLAEAMSSVHFHGIVHRDLKPDNIMLVSDVVAPYGVRVKILDFGLAKLRSDNVKAYGIETQVGIGFGTIMYIAPEQVFDARNVNDKADVYALGIIMFEMVSGRCPFMADNQQEILGAHLTQTPPNLIDLDATLPLRLSTLVAGMLAKDPNKRPSMRQVVWQIDGLLNSLRHQSGTTVMMPQLETTEPKRPPRATRAIVFGVLGAILPIVLFTHSCHSSRTAPAVETPIVAPRAQEADEPKAELSQQVVPVENGFRVLRR